MRAYSSQIAHRLAIALAQLPVAQREAFLLQQEAGMSLAQIAELTGAGEETIKSRLRYATAKLYPLLRVFSMHQVTSYKSESWHGWTVNHWQNRSKTSSCMSTQRVIGNRADLMRTRA